MKNICNIIVTIILLVFLSACAVPHETLVNFNTGSPFPTDAVEIPAPPPLIVEPDDILLISVHAQSLLVAAPYNLGSTEENIQGVIPGEYLVRKDNCIIYPGLGSIKVGGNTIEQIIEIFEVKLSPFLTAPIIRVRLKGVRFTILGEVTRPTQFSVEREKTTILEALGMAGDLTPYGDRTDILIIRERSGQRSFGHLNLQDRNIFDSPYFYLQQNDVIYVKPIEQKRAIVRDQSQNIVPWVAVFVSFATLLATILR